MYETATLPLEQQLALSNVQMHLSLDHRIRKGFDYVYMATDSGLHFLCSLQCESLVQQMCQRFGLSVSSWHQAQ